MKQIFLTITAMLFLSSLSFAQNGKSEPKAARMELKDSTALRATPQALRQAPAENPAKPNQAVREPQPARAEEKKK
jgi:hypothetical protein